MLLIHATLALDPLYDDKLGSMSFAPGIRERWEAEQRELGAKATARVLAATRETANRTFIERTM